MARTYGPCGEITVQGGGSPKSESLTIDDIPSGSNGDILTINVPQGRLVRLTGLLTTTTNVESGVTLTVDGNEYFSGNLSESTNFQTNSSTFAILNAIGTDVAAVNFAGLASEVTAETSIVLTKDTGNTTQTIRYAYEVIRP